MKRNLPRRRSTLSALGLSCLLLLVGASCATIAYDKTQKISALSAAELWIVSQGRTLQSAQPSKTVEQANAAMADARIASGAVVVVDPIAVLDAELAEATKRRNRSDIKRLKKELKKLKKLKQAQLASGTAKPARASTTALVMAVTQAVETREGVPKAVKAHREAAAKRKKVRKIKTDNFSEFQPTVERTGTFSDTIEVNSKVTDGIVRVATKPGKCPQGTREYVEHGSLRAVLPVTYLLPRYMITSGDCGDSSVAVTLHEVAVTVGTDRLGFALQSVEGAGGDYEPVPDADPKTSGGSLGGLGMRMGRQYDAEKGFTGASAVVSGEVVYTSGDQQLVLEYFDRALTDHETISLLADKAFQFAIDNVHYPPVEVFEVSEVSVSSSAASGSLVMGCPFGSEETSAVILEKFSGLEKCSNGDKGLACHPGCDIRFNSVSFAGANATHQVSANKGSTFKVTWSMPTGPTSEFGKAWSGNNDYGELKHAFLSANQLRLQFANAGMSSTSAARKKIEKKRKRKRNRFSKKSKKSKKAATSADKPPQEGDMRMFVGTKRADTFTRMLQWSKPAHRRTIWLTTHRAMASDLATVAKQEYDTLSHSDTAEYAVRNVTDSTAQAAAFLDRYWCNKNAAAPALTDKASQRKRSKGNESAAASDGAAEPAVALADKFSKDRTICASLAKLRGYSHQKFASRIAVLEKQYQRELAIKEAKRKACIKKCQKTVKLCDSANEYFCAGYLGPNRCGQAPCPCCHPSKNECSFVCGG